MRLVPRRACGWIAASKPGCVLVLQPRYATGLLGRYVQPRLKESKRYLRVPLEERGSFLWLTMDGALNAADLAGAFGQEFPDDAQAVPERVAMFLYAMFDNHLIEFVNLNDTK